MKIRRLLEIVKWVLWTCALVGAVRKVLSFSRVYMRNNIGHEHMYPDRNYLCLWFWPGEYIFITDVYSKTYKDMYSICTMLNSRQDMINQEWSFTARLWGDKHGRDPRFKTCKFNDIPEEIMPSLMRWGVWRILISHKQGLGVIECPDTVVYNLSSAAAKLLMKHWAG